jgi:tetratricopeptide (TPR) repeat protein
LAWWQRDFATAATTAEAAGKQHWYDSTNTLLQPVLLAAQAHTAAGDSATAKPLYLKVKDSMRTALQARPDDSDLHLTLGFANAGLSLREEAIAEARKAMSLMPVSRDAVSGPAVQSAAAKIFASVGANDEAIDLVRQLLQIPCGRVMSVALLKLDPAWDPLRKDARFDKLLADADVKSGTQSSPKP